MTQLVAALFAISDAGSVLTEHDKDVIHDGATALQYLADVPMPRRARLARIDMQGTRAVVLNMYDAVTKAKWRMEEAENEVTTNKGGE